MKKSHFLLSFSLSYLHYSLQLFFKLNYYLQVGLVHQHWYVWSYYYLQYLEYCPKSYFLAFLFCFIVKPSCWFFHFIAQFIYFWTVLWFSSTPLPRALSFIVFALPIFWVVTGVPLLIFLTLTVFAAPIFFLLTTFSIFPASFLLIFSIFLTFIVIVFFLLPSVFPVFSFLIQFLIVIAFFSILPV